MFKKIIIKLQVFQAKACVWYKKQADTMDSAIWTDTQPVKTNKVTAVVSL